MKRALVELGGDWQETTITLYLHPKYTDPLKPFFLDCAAVNREGYKYVVECDLDLKGCILKVANAPQHEDRTFIFVSITNPLKIFDQSKIKCNVPIQVERTHSIIGWVVYGLVLTCYKLKESANAMLRKR